MPAIKTNYALYKEPDADHAMRFVQTQGEPQELADYAELNGKTGFVFAPFMPSENTPVMLINPDRVEQLGLRHTSTPDKADRVVSEKTDRASYMHDFSCFHEALDARTFDKLVLARSLQVNLSEAVDAEDLFWKACRLYPRVYVALVSTAKSGTWLMATPEVLLTRTGSVCRTMALAGTMKLDAMSETINRSWETKNERKMVWSHKNKTEQHMVVSYISEKLREFSSDIWESEAYSEQAGNLIHLRSDFIFTPDKGKNIGDMVKALFPTPAVCGLPKEDAWAFIQANESCDRKYYSGFTGTILSEDDVRLYVTLRCMQIEGERLCLYAGGGLLTGSREEQEWKETQAKLETMKKLVYV